MEIRVVLGYPVEKGKESIDSHEPLAIESRFNLQKGLINAKPVELGRTFQIEVQALGLCDAFEPILQKPGILVERD